MKPNDTNTNRPHAGTSFGKACLASCQKILSGIARAKQAIFMESSRAFNTPERLLRLALNEAEALAWETQYPHLVFPTLAAEKVEAVAAWSARQQSVRQASPMLGLAA